MHTRTIIILVIICLLFGGGYLYMLKKEPSATPVTEMPDSALKTLAYSNAEHGISFMYPETYEIQEIEGEGNNEHIRHTITLIAKKDLPVPAMGEGPPAITIDIFQNNLDAQTTEGWIRNTSESNFKLSSEGRLASTTIGGKEALSYRWSGLYEGTTIVHASPKWVYAFSVTYLEMGADIVQDFATIRDSVRITISPI